MATDIRLNDGNNHDGITLDSATVRATGTDFMLDNQARRGGHGGPLRRALVHNQDDGLTINFNGDYPAGVRIVGATLNIKHQKQNGLDPKLPKQAAVGDIVMLQNVASAALGGGFAEPIGEAVSLWLCVSKLPLTQIAVWQKLTLGDSVSGTE